MSDQDFIILDEDEKKEDSSSAQETEKKETAEVSSSEQKKDDDGYEKICFICHRPESVTGKMIELPNNISVCPDCMQRSFDAMNNGSIDLNRLMNMPGVQFFNMSDLENMQPKQQKIKKKKRETERVPPA